MTQDATGREPKLHYDEPMKYAAEELARWQSALNDQREAERHLNEVRRRGPRSHAVQLLSRVDRLRTRADLLLAEAVGVMCAFRDGRVNADPPTSTRMDLPEGRQSCTRHDTVQRGA